MNLFCCYLFLYLYLYASYFISEHLCDTCGKGFATTTGLAQHQKTHGEAELACPDCPQRFKRVSSLRKHADIHSNLKYVCNLCNKEMSSYAGYKKHKGSKLICILYRLLIFSNESLLILVVHHGTVIKNHHCPLCPLKFSQKNKLTVHMNSHTKLKRNYMN